MKRVKIIAFDDNELYLTRNSTISVILVPQVLRICSQFIEEFGIINGIYRASGISSNIQRIK